MNWSELSGDGPRRFCDECKMHVHDLSACARDEALAIVRAAAARGERVCGRIARHPKSGRALFGLAATLAVSACSAADGTQSPIQIGPVGPPTAIAVENDAGAPDDWYLLGDVSVVPAPSATVRPRAKCTVRPGKRPSR